jgi:Nif-specific regulatory protein
VGEGITGRVVQTGEAIVVPDIAKDPRFLHRTRPRETDNGKKIAFFCVPIKLEGRTVGALSVDSQAGRGAMISTRACGCCTSSRR